MDKTQPYGAAAFADWVDSNLDTLSVCAEGESNDKVRSLLSSGVASTNLSLGAHLADSADHSAAEPSSGSEPARLIVLPAPRLESQYGWTPLGMCGLVLAVSATDNHPAMVFSRLVPPGVFWPPRSGSLREIGRLGHSSVAPVAAAAGTDPSAFFSIGTQEGDGYWAAIDGRPFEFYLNERPFVMRLRECDYTNSVVVESLLVHLDIPGNAERVVYPVLRYPASPTRILGMFEGRESLGRRLSDPYRNDFGVLRCHEVCKMKRLLVEGRDAWERLMRFPDPLF